MFTVEDSERIEVQLVQEIRALRRHLAELEQAEHEPKQRQESLRKTGETLHSIFQNMPVMVSAFDSYGNIIMWNRQCERVTGYSAQNIIGNPKAIELLYPDATYRESVMSGWNSYGNKYRRWESKITCNNGSVKNVLWFSISDQLPILGWTIWDIGVDTTAHRQVPEVLQESEEKWRSLLENEPDTIASLSHDGTILFVNHTVTKSTAEQVIGKSVYDYVPREHYDRVKKSIEWVFRTGMADRYELVGVGPYGTTLWYEIRIGPIKHRGRIVAASLIIADITERRKAEQKFRELEEKYKQLVSITTEAIMLFDAETGQFIEVNKACERLYGYCKEEFLDLKHNDITAELKMSEGYISKLLRRKLEKSPVRYHKKIDGTLFPVEISTSSFELRGKRVICEVVRDITESEKTEQVLRESEQRFRSIFDNAADGMLLIDVESKKFYAGNKVMCQMLGCDPEDINNLGINDIHSQEHLPYVIKQFEKQAKKQFALAGDIPVKRQNGSVFYADINSFPITLAGKTYLMGFFRDITERKKAEEEIRRLTSAVDQSIDGIVIGDLELKLVYVNDAYARMHGYLPEEMIGMPVTKLHSDKQMDEFEGGMNRLKTHGSWEGEIEHTKKDGTCFSTYMSATLLKNGDGKPTGILAVARDITESKHKEKELDTYREKMVRAEQLASLGTLSASFAHELTQPLMAIRLSIENLLEDLGTISCPATVMEALKNNVDEVTNAISIVDRFRNFARTSSVDIVSEINLKVVAEKIVRLFDKTARRAQVTLRLKGMDRLPTVYWNERDIEQLFFALVQNAMQAADGKENSKLVISGTARDKHILLRFSDNCGGIAPENLNRIFQPFFTTKPPGEGTGLGLCIVQRIASQAGGRVRVESKLGKGSTFFVTLPIEGGKRS